jgi:predicted flap endonuclease-1-like 5' DNA nuclease
MSKNLLNTSIEHRSIREKNMRSDYTLYFLAIIFLAIAATIVVFVTTELERNLSALAAVIMGLFSAGAGYMLRPRTRTMTIEAPPPPPQVTTTPAPVVEPVQPKEVEVEAKPASKPMELTAVKGIKEKRAEQLKALGITNVKDLANASAQDLAVKLKIAQYFPEQWIKNAKELLEKS